MLAACNSDMKLLCIAFVVLGLTVQSIPACNVHEIFVTSVNDITLRMEPDRTNKMTTEAKMNLSMDNRHVEG